MLARHIRPQLLLPQFWLVIDDVLNLGMDAVTKMGSRAHAGGHKLVRLIGPSRPQRTKSMPRNPRNRKATAPGPASFGSRGGMLPIKRPHFPFARPGLLTWIPCMPQGDAHLISRPQSDTRDRRAMADM